MTMQNAGHSLVTMVSQYHGWCHASQGVALSQRGCHHGVAHSHIAGSCQVNVVPNTDVAPTDGRYPVPANRGMECRVIGPEDTAVKVSILLGLDLHTARIGIGMNEHFQVVVFVLEIGRDVKFTTLESTLNAAQIGTIEPYFRFPVDAVKIEKYTLALNLFGQIKITSIDKVSIEKRFRCHQQIIIIIHVRQCPDIDIT